MNMNDDNTKDNTEDTAKNLWPWATLGLDSSCIDERVVKRAYAKRLKVVRPDEDPEAFQVLREDYESALEIIKIVKLSLPSKFPAEQENAYQEPLDAPATAINEPEGEPSDPQADQRHVVETEVFYHPGRCAQTLWNDYTAEMIALLATASPEEMRAHWEQFMRREQFENFLVYDAFEKHAALYCASEASDAAQRHMLIEGFQWPDNLPHFCRFYPHIADKVIEQYKRDMAFVKLSDSLSQVDGLQGRVAHALLEQTPPPYSFRLLQRPFFVEIKDVIEKTRSLCPEWIGTRLNADVFCWWEEKVTHPRWYYHDATLLALGTLMAFVNLSCNIDPFSMTTWSLNFWAIAFLFFTLCICIEPTYAEENPIVTVISILDLRRNPVLERWWLAIFFLFSTALFFKPKGQLEIFIVVTLFESVAIAFFCASAMLGRITMLIVASVQVALIGFLTYTASTLGDVRFMIGTLPLSILLVNGGQYYCRQLHITPTLLNKLRRSWLVAALLTLGLCQAPQANQTAMSALSWILALCGLLISDTYCRKIKPTVFFIFTFFALQLVINLPNKITAGIPGFVHTPPVLLLLVALTLIANIAISRHFNREFS